MTPEQLEAIEAEASEASRPTTPIRIEAADLLQLTAAARELHRIRESPGLTAEQREDAEWMARNCTPHQRETVAALLAAYDSQAAALADRDAEIKRLKAQLAEPAERAAQWRTIESAPKDGTKILAFTGNGQHPIVITRWANSYGLVGVDADAWCWSYPGFMTTVTPTHWQPLPLQPRTTRRSDAQET